MPFRVIISERDIWQKSVALYLQERLKRLEFHDPFVFKNSNEVLQFLDSDCDKQLCAFSIDVKDLFYYLPHDELLDAVEECIDSKLAMDV